MGALVLFVSLLGSCPGCIVWALHQKASRRPPFRQTTGLAFHICFAFLCLSVVLASLVAVEGEARAAHAYQRSKCAALLSLDVLANGLRPEAEALGGGEITGFVGLRPLASAARASESTFPSLLRGLEAARAALPNETQDSFAIQAPQYMHQWDQVQRGRMEVTPYHCKPCEPDSLRPLNRTIEAYKSTMASIQAALTGAQTFVEDAEAPLKRMRNHSLGDVTALLEATRASSSLLNAMLDEFEDFWQQLCEALRQFALAALAALLLGVLCLALCPGSEGAALVAWWFAYFVTLGLLPISAFLLPAAVASRDASALLQAATSSQSALQTFNDTAPLRPLHTDQFEALASCVAADGDGDLRRSLGLDAVGPSEVAAAERLLGSLGGLAAVRLDNTSAEAFFLRYENLNGTAYTANWNSSMNLGQRGLDDLSGELHAMSQEQWAFSFRKAPPGCVLAMPFSVSTAVSTKNCWLVNKVSPSDQQIRDRYLLSSPSQMAVLNLTFARARASAQALESEYVMVNEAPQVHRSWTKASTDLTTALATARTEVAAPARQTALDMVRAANATDCSSVRAALLFSARALGDDFVRAQVTLWACSSILAASCLGLTALYCFLWHLRQSGATHRSGFPRQGFPVDPLGRGGGAGADHGGGFSDDEGGGGGGGYLGGAGTDDEEERRGLLQ